MRVSTRLDHDSGPSTYEIWFALAPAPPSSSPSAASPNATAPPSRVRLIGPADGPDAGPSSAPLWLTERIRVVTGRQATVVAGGRQTDLGDWLRRAESAESAVRSRIASSPDARWSTGLVIELPSTEQAFDQVLGAEPGSYDQIAAVAWPQGPDPATAAVRVVVNPKPAGALDDDRLAVLITHEATHVLTRSATSPAPMWLVEGFADWVAFDRVPAAAPPTRDLVIEDVRRHGPPAEFPGDASFRPDADDLNLTYGRAWLLCSYIAERWSDADLVRLYAEVDGGTALPGALQDVLGVDESTLLSGWQRWLARSATR
ncbi:hypothetical protein [Microlunatus ginsengisoli]|uniref:Peptidase MA superfamily protein n=1 Tax=Microlunatus ginsengisoli TaxID=363863 RepID=A0ABP6ZTJ3_9ACTN